MATIKREELAITLPLGSLANMTRGQEMPDKAKIIFALMSIGMKPPKIARMLGNTLTTITDYINRYDKDGCIVDAILAKKFFLAGTFESIATQISATITEDDIAKLSLVQKIAVAEKCLKIASSINLNIPDVPPDVDDALAKLKK